MKNKEQSSDNLSIDFDKRFVRITIDDIAHNNIVHGTLENPHAMGSYSVFRIRANSPISSRRLAIGDKLWAFFSSPTHNKRELWHGSIGMLSSRTTNPWHLKQISLGDEVEGRVINYIEDYGVIIQLKHNRTRNYSWEDDTEFTGFLHRNNTPDSSRNIQDSVHIGDLIYAEIDSLDENRLRIGLSVNQTRDSLLRKLSDIKSAKTLPQVWKSELEYKAEELANKNILLIDNDHVFCKGLQKGLKTLNLQVRYITSHSDIDSELDYLETCSAVLLDYDLGCSSIFWQELLLKLDMWQKGLKGRQCVVISGDIELDLSSRLPKDWLLRFKPIRPGYIRKWLDTGTWSEQATTSISNLDRWRNSEKDNLIVERAELFLQKCIEDTSATNALWIVRSRPGFYEIRVATYRIQNARSFEKSLGETIIGNALDANSISARKISSAGDVIKTIAPDGTWNITVIPFELDSIVDRALVFFSVKELSNNDLSILKRQIIHAQDIALALRLNQLLKESEVFAAQGLLRSSEMHEMRNLAGALTGEIALIEKQAERPEWLANPQEIILSLQAVLRISTAMNDLGEVGLVRIRTDQVKEVKLLTIVKNTVSLMRNYALKNDVELVFMNDTIDEDITLPIYRTQIELPLINLLDNAIHHSYKGGIVQISIQYQPNALQHPYTVKVRDFGTGIRYGEVQRMFEPRQTSRGKSGSGMGLYLSRNLLLDAGGKLNLLENVLWIGSCFEILLPDQVIKEQK